MSTTISLPFLDSVRIASPCSARWEDMQGDHRTRRCADCCLSVHNISDMTRDEAECFLRTAATDRVCVRLYRRTDGTILTRDCPIALRIARAKLLKATARIATAIGLVVLAASAARAAQNPSWSGWGWAIRLRNSTPVQWVSWKKNMGWKVPFPGGNSMNRGGFAMGKIAIPQVPAPPIPSAMNIFGPHPREYYR